MSRIPRQSEVELTRDQSGSADTRTTDYVSLQNSLLQMQQCGVLTKHDVGRTGANETSTQSMQSSWVKGAMLIRCNSLIRGKNCVIEKQKCL